MCDEVIISPLYPQLEIDALIVINITKIFLL